MIIQINKYQLEDTIIDLNSSGFTVTKSNINPSNPDKIMLDFQHFPKIQDPSRCPRLKNERFTIKRQISNWFSKFSYSRF